MEKQLNFTDIEYSRRRKKTKREEFLRKMDAVVPWELWVEQIRPYFPDGRRGRRRKARYKGIAKNLNYAYLSFASANLYMLASFT